MSATAPQISEGVAVSDFAGSPRLLVCDECAGADRWIAHPIGRYWATDELRDYHIVW